jgi:hypothetical protein
LPASFTKPFKEIYKYDNNNRLSVVTEKAWHPAKNVFDITGKKMFFYNAQGLIDSISFKMNALALEHSFKYAYDKQGRLETFYDYFFDQGQWYIAEKMVYSYNDLGKISEIKHLVGYIGYIGQIATFKFTYNEAGKLKKQIKISNWEDFVMEQTVYEWDSNGRLSSELFEDLLYKDKFKTEYSYNANGDIIKSKYFSGTNSDWLKSGYKEYNYCELNCADIINAPNPCTFYSEGLECGLKNLKKANKAVSVSALCHDGALTENTQYYYSPLTKGGTTGVNKLNIADINVYPNPATDKITFTWNGDYSQFNLRICQVTGACVIDKEISSNETVDVSDLSKGIYLFRLTNNKEIVKTGKLVVE